MPSMHTIYSSGPSNMVYLSTRFKFPRLTWSARWGLMGIIMLLAVAGGRGGNLSNGTAVVEALTLDQSHIEPYNLGASLIGCCKFIAQTFTAGLTGTLGGININLGSSPTPLHVAIHTVVNGVPSTTVLGETTLGSTPPITQLITFPQVINYVAGVQYAIVINFEEAPPTGIDPVWTGTQSDPYPYGGNYASVLDGIS
jgi:hypothetical protein